ncbi:MAG: hypothetical protein WBF42_16800 [Terracidiphilus sp.]
MSTRVFPGKERVQRALMICAAVVLFGLGMLLLMAPGRPRDSGAAAAGDNGLHCAEVTAQCGLLRL